MQQLPDQRTGKNCLYSMEDAALAAFSVFYTQSPSFLAHQRTMEKSKRKSNAQTIFGMERIPTDNCIRDLLDPVAPEHLYPLFGQVFDALNAAGHIDAMRVPLKPEGGRGQLLIALDGTNYHHSHTIHCSQCTKIEHANGEVSYQHTVVTPVVVSPGKDPVISLEPEFVVPQDGHDKQDCETAAAKRWLAARGERLKGYDATILGDDLYSRQPMCDAVLALDMDFIFVCKPSSHDTLYEWVEDFTRNGFIKTHEIQRRRGKEVFTDTYRYALDLPLRERDDALKVNWFELTTTDRSGKQLFHNAWITSLALNEGNVATMAEAARARWKIENGCNNVMKTKGYHLEHNFGHGKKHLAALLATMNFIAFLLHTVQELAHVKYRLLRENLPSRKAFFQSIQALTTFMCFDSFEALLDFMLAGLEIDVPDSG
ncbi:MAG: ISNCY family transposase [Betaproteobacteria bacterium]|nr:ISNCY family transposase [Betaproteobacteria bacterium]